MSRNEAFAPWQCPLCGGALQGENDLKCEKGHCFDRAREGYWHLLPVQSMRTKAPGDSKEMVAARRAFLNAGYYSIFGQALGDCRLLSDYISRQQNLAAYPYYDEPLTPSGGVTSQLPVLLAEYTFRNTRDIKDYLGLLSQMDTYFLGILDYEQKKADAGLFMSDAAVAVTVLPKRN